MFLLADDSSRSSWPGLTRSSTDFLPYRGRRGCARLREERASALRHDELCRALLRRLRVDLAGYLTLMARASWSAGWAPEMAYFCANTKVGMPRSPSDASCAWPEISATSSSVAKALADIVGIEADVARGLHQYVDIGRRSPPRRGNATPSGVASSRRACRCASAQWIRRVAIDGVGLALYQLGP